MRHSDTTLNRSQALTEVFSRAMTTKNAAAHLEWLKRFCEALHIDLDDIKVGGQKVRLVEYKMEHEPNGCEVDDASDTRLEMDISFFKELIALINKYSMENHTDTPDYIMADYIMGCLNHYKIAVRKRDAWHGFKGWEHVND